MGPSPSHSQVVLVAGLPQSGKSFFLQHIGAKSASVSSATSSAALADILLKFNILPLALIELILSYFAFPTQWLLNRAAKKIRGKKRRAMEFNFIEVTWNPPEDIANLGNLRSLFFTKETRPPDFVVVVVDAVVRNGDEPPAVAFPLTRTRELLKSALATETSIVLVMVMNYDSPVDLVLLMSQLAGLTQIKKKGSQARRDASWVFQQSNQRACEHGMDWLHSKIGQQVANVYLCMQYCNNSKQWLVS